MPDEEITLREFLDEKFIGVKKDIEDVSKDVARLDGKYQEFERKLEVLIDNIKDLKEKIV